MQIDPPPVRVSEEDGFVDVELPIHDVWRHADGTVVVVARGKFENEILGIVVELLPDWVAQPRDGFCPWWGAVRITSDGFHSDRLLTVLGNLYGIKDESKSMKRSLQVQAVGLNDDPTQVQSKRTHMKVFFQDGGEDEYAEIFVNVDIPAGILELHEKDIEYRASVLRSLASET